MINGELFDRYKETGDINIRNEIVEKYLYMVEVLIRKYLNKGVDYDDLYQVGAMALVSAVERFDPSKGFEFSSFATPTILGEIKKYFRDKEWILKVPRRQKEISLKIPAAKEELYENSEEHRLSLNSQSTSDIRKKTFCKPSRADRLTVHTHSIKHLMKTVRTARYLKNIRR